MFGGGVMMTGLESKAWFSILNDGLSSLRKFSLSLFFLSNIRLSWEPVDENGEDLPNTDLTPVQFIFRNLSDDNLFILPKQQSYLNGSYIDNQIVLY